MSGNGVLGFGARLKKLRAMSAAELAHRVHYTAVLAIERRLHQQQRLASPDRLRKALVKRLDRRAWEQQLLASRMARWSCFFSSVAAPDEMHRLFATKYERELSATLAHATRARRHEFGFFGRQFEYGDLIPWQSDPVSGTPWPAVYHADVPVHRGNIGYGDVKYVWELSRQQHLIDLGKAWFLARSADDLQAVQRLVASWIDGNPYATGVNWSCALEPAFRTFSWLWAYHLTAADLDEQFHLIWLQGFYDHGRFLERHLELYSSPYNHLIAEAAALYMLGVCFPEFRRAARWQARGRAVLEGRLDQQFYRDGGSVEQSTFYHHATIGFYLLAAVLARATGDDLSSRTWNAIERALDFSMHLSQPDGTTPAIGGADDGKPIRMEHLPFWDFRPYQAMGAVLFGRPDFKRVAGRFHEDALWLLGPAGLARFEALDNRVPRDTSVHLASSGYSVLRSDWSARANYVCFDCGEQAAGMRHDSVPNSMHGHADCLSVIAWLDGRRILVDSGLFAYNCGGTWEAHFRETAAHNTAKVDGRDQATHIGKMAWSHSYRARHAEWHAGAREAWAVGSHDGYARGPNGVVHRRAVWLRPDSYLLIYDEFVGRGQHEIAVNYQFAPGTLEQTGAASARFDGSFEVAWAGSQHWMAQTRCGGPHPEDGWIAPSLGLRHAAPRLTLTCTSRAPRTCLLTVLACATASAAYRIGRSATGQADGVLMTVSGNDYVDWIAAAGVAGMGPIETDALLAICRVGGDGDVEATRVGGSRLHVDVHALLSGWTDAAAPLGAGR